MKFRNKLNYKNQLIIIIKKEWKWDNKDMIINGSFRKDIINFRITTTGIQITMMIHIKKDIDKLVKILGSIGLITTSTKVKSPVDKTNMKIGNQESIGLRYQLNLLNIQTCHNLKTTSNHYLPRSGPKNS